MANQWVTQGYDLMTTDHVRVVNHRYGQDKQRETEVWIERSERGQRFMTQLFVAGEPYAVGEQIYVRECYIVRDKVSGKYGFLDRNDCGYWLHTATFVGAQTFSGPEAVKVQQWLAETIPIEASAMA